MSNQAIFKILVALGVLLHASNCFYWNHLIRYTQTTLQYYAALHSATFDLWIYITNTDPVVQGLVSSPYLTTVPRTLITPRSPSLPDQKPSFIIMSLTSSQTSLLKLLINVDIHTPVFVFCWNDSPQAIEKMSKLFGAYGLTKVVLIPTNPDSTYVCLKHPIKRSFEKMRQLPPVEDLFAEEKLRNLGGYEVHLVIQENTRQVKLDDRGFAGTHSSWFRSTIRHLNGSCIVRRAMRCPTGQIPSEFRLRLVQECIKHNWIMVNPFYSDRTTPDFLISVLSSSMVLMAPNGRILSDLEVFLEPYDLEVWLTLLVILVICLIAQQMFFKSLESNLILMTVCGLEGGEIDRSKGPMAICFAALIFYSFLMQESYTTLIISFMTEKPLTDFPRVISDFERFGIRIKTSSEFLASSNRSGIYKQVDYDQNWKFHPCQMQYGILEWDALAKLFVQREGFCKRKEFGHHVLNETLGMMVELYLFGRWNPLKVAFERSQRRLLEAGFFECWAAQFERLYFNYWRTREANPDGVTMLDLSDLEGAFLALGIGSLLSLLAFGLEFIAVLTFWK